MLASLPPWLGLIGVLFVVAAALGSAMAVYRTNLQGTSLREAERTIERLRGEIQDYERRETTLEADIKLLQEKDNAKLKRIEVLEDLLTRRSDDEKLQAELAAIRKVNESVVRQLTAMTSLLTREKY